MTTALYLLLGTLAAFAIAGLLSWWAISSLRKL